MGKMKLGHLATQEKSNLGGQIVSKPLGIWVLICHRGENGTHCTEQYWERKESVCQCPRVPLASPRTGTWRQLILNCKSSG